MKKNRLYIILIEVVIFIIMFLLAVADARLDSFCNSFNENSGTTHYCANFLWIITPIIFVFPFSLITYFLKEEIFHSWIKFTYVWIPLSMFLVFIIPGGRGNGAFPSLIDNQLIAILMSGLFSIISLIMIIWLSIKYYWFKK